MATAFLSLKPPYPPLPRPPFFPSTTSHHQFTFTSTYPKPHNHRIFPEIPLPVFRNNNGSPQETECPVPLDQQPINEYQALSKSFPFSWASSSLVEYCGRLLATGASFAILVGLPVSWFGSIAPKTEPLRLVLGTAASGFFVVTLAVVRMYLGWAYVGNRLLSATVEYEETGWYDGQIWVKTAEVLARDRLLGSFSVKPALIRLKNTLLVLGTSLFICVLLLVNTESSQKDAYIVSQEPGGRSVPGVYNDESARSFEPDAFCGEPVTP